jgi:hypothetical protein
MLNLNYPDAIIEEKKSMINFSKQLKIFMLLKEMESYQSQNLDFDKVGALLITC